MSSKSFVSNTQKLKYMKEEEFVAVMINNVSGKDRYSHCVYKLNHGVMTGVEVSNMIMDVVGVAAQFGIHIGAAICDGASSNRWWQEMFFTNEDNPKSKVHVVRKNHPVTNEPFYFISDPSHGIKKIINILLQSNGHDVRIEELNTRFQQILFTNFILNAKQVSVG